MTKKVNMKMGYNKLYNGPEGFYTKDEFDTQIPITVELDGSAWCAYYTNHFIDLQNTRHVGFGDSVDEAVRELFEHGALQ